MQRQRQFAPGKRAHAFCSEPAARAAEVGDSWVFRSIVTAHSVPS